MSFKTADLCDAHEGKVQVLHPGLINFGGRSRFYGEIVTIKALGDFSQVREQVRSTGAGRVLVVDNDGSMQCAMLGDLLAAAAHENGWQGIVIMAVSGTRPMLPGWTSVSRRSAACPLEVGGPIRASLA